MRKITLSYLLVFSFLIIPQVHVSAQRLYQNLEDALINQRKLYGSDGPENLNWINNGNEFSFSDEKGSIKKFNPATLKEEIVFNPDEIKFPGTQTDFSYKSFQWSLDSKYILFQANFKAVWRHSGVADYYLYSIVSKELKLVAQDAYTAQLSPDNKIIGFERDGNLFITNVASLITKQLTFDAKDFFYNGRMGWAYEEEFGLVQGWVWSPDSKYISFWQVDETKVPIFQYTDYNDINQTFEKVPYPKVGDSIPTVRIGVLNVITNDLHWLNVSAGDGYIPRIYWTALPNQLAVVTINRRQNDMKLFFADVETNNVKMIMEEKNEQWIDLFSFPKGVMHYFNFPSDDKEFFWISERDGWSHIYRYNYDGVLINQVTKGNWEVENILHADVKNKKIYYLSTENSPLERQLYCIGFDGKNKKQITSVNGVHAINFSSNAKFYIDKYSNTHLPWQIDLCSSDGKVVKKLEDNADVTAYTKEINYTFQDLENFTDSGGKKIDISILKPYNFSPYKKYPVLLSVYGGPQFESVTNQFSADGWSQYLSQQGYVIVKVNNHGSDGYGSAFKKSVYRELGVLECKDFADAAKYMSTFSWIDQSKIAIYGHSYGGFTSAFSIVNYPDIFKAAIIAAPVTNWRNYDAPYTERYMGLLPEDSVNYKISAVTSYVANLKGDVLLAHSTFDDNVHVINTMQLLRLLIDNKKDFELKLYQEGGHGIAYDRNSYLLLYKQYTEFLNKELK